MTPGPTKAGDLTVQRRYPGRVEGWQALPKNTPNGWNGPHTYFPNPLLKAHPHHLIPAQVLKPYQTLFAHSILCVHLYPTLFSMGYSKLKPPAIREKGYTVGRPTAYSLELAEKFCARLITEDKSVEEICKSDDMPARSAIMRWLNKHREFKELYVLARELQTEIGYDKMDAIASAPLPTSPVLDESGKEIGQEVLPGVAMAEMQRRKLQIDVIKFKLVKLQPRRFGDNRNVTVEQKDPRKLTPEEFKQLLLTAASAPTAPLDSEYTDFEDIPPEEYTDEDDLFDLLG